MRIDPRTVPFSRFGSYLVISVYGGEDGEAGGWEVRGQSGEAGKQGGRGGEAGSEGGRGGEAVVLRDVGGGDEAPGVLLRIVPLGESGEAAMPLVDADETELRISVEGAAGGIRVCFPGEDDVLIRSEGLGFRLDFAEGKYEHLNALGDREWEYHSYAGEVKLRLRLEEGTGSALSSGVDSGAGAGSAWSSGVDSETGAGLALNSEVGSGAGSETSGGMGLEFFGGVVVLGIERYRCVPRDRGREAGGDYEGALAGVRGEYEDYREGAAADCPGGRWGRSRGLAAYITWSSVVHPSGHLKKYAMYMSNNWMTNLWSWDNCFNAIALAGHRPGLAYDQFIVFADFQDDSGVLPDFVNDRSASFSCCKPPIYGWAYRLLMELNPYFEEPGRLKEVYGMLKGVERYWRVHRMIDGWPLPYYSHGNDSGWDNATVFDGGCPVTSPDLPAYLILLYEALEDIAGRLGSAGREGPECQAGGGPGRGGAAGENEVRVWRERGERMKGHLIERLWDGKRFRSWDPVRRRRVESEFCLIDWMPIAAAHRLPGEIRDALAEHLVNGGHRTRFGLASEAPGSPEYRSEGYWRGPIWAPVMLLIADGLRRCGETEAAGALARGFCEAVLKGGMAENFDALSGRGLVDPAFTWTSSVFLHFAGRYL